MYRRSMWIAIARFAQAAVLMGAVFLASGAVQPAGAQSSIRVPADEARVVPLVKSPSTVIVGNPSIADVSVQNGNLLVVMGKNYGTTNIIVLDSIGDEIANLALNVTTGGLNEVSLHRGSARTTLNCAPMCEEELNVGDSGTQFEKIFKQTSSKTSLSDSSAQQSPDGE